MTPDVLLVGHIAKDRTDDGWRAGGSILYAAEQCRRLGMNVGAVTVCGPGIDPESLVPGVAWRVLRDTTSTTFENHYVEGRRQQRLLERARPIVVDDIPDEWQAAPVVLLMPVFHDVDPAIISSLTGSATLLGLSVQGWLRQLDITDVSPPAVAPDASAWQGAGLIFVSDEDLADPEAVVEWAGQIPAVVLTRGRQGTTVWSDGVRTDLPACAAREVDPTGAGDVFAAACTVRLWETGDLLGSARYASAAAALSVEGDGTTTIGGREQIEARLRREAA